MTTAGQRQSPSHGSAVQVVESLREAIVRGDYPPGARLIEAEVAAALRISRTPVREAIRRLAGEGILDLVPNQGAVVPSWDARTVAEVFEIRAQLESYSVRLAAQRVRDEDLVDLRSRSQAMRELEGARGAKRWDTYAVCNHAFHRWLCELSDNERLTGMVVGLMGMPLLHRHFDGHTSVAMQRSNDHHDEIIDALEARDPQWAEAAMRLHVESTRRLLVSAWGRGRGER